LQPEELLALQPCESLDSWNRRLDLELQGKKLQSKKVFALWFVLDEATVG